MKNLFVLALVVSGLALGSGCSSNEVTCDHCHRQVSADKVDCSDCYAKASQSSGGHHEAHCSKCQSAIGDDAVCKACAAANNEAANTKLAPEAKETPTIGPRRTPEQLGHQVVIFLNGFNAPQETDAIQAALEKDGDFSDYLPGGGSPKRVVLKFKYYGSDIKQSIQKTMKNLGIRYHFKEAALAGQVEVVSGL